ncbi:NUDIX domain-containing protein [Streptomyces sp. NPDC001070]
MTEPRLPSAGVDFLDVQRLGLSEAAPPALSPEHRSARDRVWDAAVAGNPNPFDGPVVACAGVEWDCPGALVLSWARVTYRHYALRRVPGAAALPPLFVNVLQPTHDGHVLVARMSASTAAPGRWQLPGGSVDPPAAHEGVLDEAASRRNAAREPAEETGLDTASVDLALWAVTRGENGGIGVVHLAPPRLPAVLRERFATAVAAESVRGREPELDRMALVGSVAELADLPGPHADYLEPIVRAYLDAIPRREG